MHRKVLAIDPGDKHIGMFFLEIIKGKYGKPIYFHSMNTRDVNDYTFELIIKLWIESWFTFYPNDETTENILIVEKFLLYGKKAKAQTGSQMKTSQLIGAIKTWWETFNIQGKKIYVEQSASMAKSWNDIRLERLGFLDKKGNGLCIPKWTQKDCFSMCEPTSTRHSRDALRHAIYYLNQYVYDKKITARKFYLDK